MSREYAVIRRPEWARPTHDEAVGEAERLARSTGWPYTVVLCLTTVRLSQTVHLADPLVTEEELP